MTKKIAIVLFNLGGPSGPDDVQPFLFNLFNDKAIISVPQPFRWLLAKLISTTRTKSAQANYAMMGGGSPLLPETEKQARALESVLTDDATEARCFIAMRYWKPFVSDAIQAVRDWAPDEIVLLPLYPQFSTTTTGSSFQEWKRLNGPDAHAVCCYPDERGVAKAHADALMSCWKDNGEPDNIRVLFSAHGLPEKIVQNGDPYQWQVEQTVHAVQKLLPQNWEFEICYQSRVGPMKWIGPSTDDSIRKAATDGKAILLTPIAFVSEHIETLVELDVEYGHLAKEAGAKTYLRAPALGTDETFIGSLATLVKESLTSDRGVMSSCGGRICPGKWGQCPHKGEPVRA